jgi:hypothetical protein
VSGDDSGLVEGNMEFRLVNSLPTTRAGGVEDTSIMTNKDIILYGLLQHERWGSGLFTATRPEERTAGLRADRTVCRINQYECERS